MALLVSAAAALLGAVGFGLGLRTVGGWLHLYRCRHGRIAADCAEWDALPLAFRGWYFTVPVFLAYAVFAAIGGLVLLNR